MLHSSTSSSQFIPVYAKIQSSHLSPVNLSGQTQNPPKILSETKSVSVQLPPFIQGQSLSQLSPVNPVGQVQL